MPPSAFDMADASQGNSFCKQLLGKPGHERHRSPRLTCNSRLQVAEVVPCRSAGAIACEMEDDRGRLRFSRSDRHVARTEHLLWRRRMALARPFLTKERSLKVALS